MENTERSGASVRKLPKPNNIVTVPTNLGLDFFRWWCVFLRPFIKLTKRETDVVASLLKHRYELSKVVSDSSVIDSIMMSDEIKKKILEDCDMSVQHLYVVMGNLKKNKVIIGNTINPRLVPNIRKDDNGIFQLLILFKEQKT